MRPTELASSFASARDDDAQLLSLERQAWFSFARLACETMLLGLGAILIVCLIHAALLFHASIVAFFVTAGSGLVSV